MKKFIASVLSIAIVMSLAACNGKQQETTVSETTTQVTETTETTKVTETTEATTATETTESTPAATAKILKKKDYVKNVRSKYKSYVNGDPDKSFTAPEILIDSDYADSINQEIENLFRGYKKAMKKGNCSVDGTEYMVCLTKEGILSVVFMEDKSVSKNFRVYNIDVTTGEKVDNARIAEIAGVKDIRQYGMDVLQDYYNGSSGGPKFKNFKAVAKKGKKLTKDDKKAQASFDEKYINEKMAIGLTDEGKMFLVLTIWDNVLGYQKEVIEKDEGDLWYEDSPDIVAPPVNYN